jgi:hypothetical protein
MLKSALTGSEKEGQYPNWSSERMHGMSSTSDDSVSKLRLVCALCIPKLQLFCSSVRSRVIILQYMFEKLVSDTDTSY